MRSIIAKLVRELSNVSFLWKITFCTRVSPGIVVLPLIVVDLIFKQMFMVLML